MSVHDDLIYLLEEILSRGSKQSKGVIIDSRKKGRGFQYLVRVKNNERWFAGSQVEERLKEEYKRKKRQKRTNEDDEEEEYEEKDDEEDDGDAKIEIDLLSDDDEEEDTGAAASSAAAAGLNANQAISIDDSDDEDDERNKRRAQKSKKNKAAADASSGTGSSGTGSSKAGSSSANASSSSMTVDDDEEEEMQEVRNCTIVPQGEDISEEILTIDQVFQNTLDQLKTTFSSPHAFFPLREKFNEILDPKKDLEEVVLETQDDIGGGYKLRRGALIYAVRNNPPKNIHDHMKPRNRPGYAYDDLIWMYFKLLQDKFPSLSTRTSTEITHLMNNDKEQRDEFQIRTYMYKKNKILFHPDGNPIYEKIIFPRHLDWGHWGLIVVDLKNLQIEYYDSMRQACDPKIFKRLLTYISASYRRQFNFGDDANPEDVDLLVDSFITQFKKIDYSLCNPPVTPLQTGVDCGYYVMEMAKYIAKGWKITANQPKAANMKYIRERCIFELKYQTLLLV